MLYSSPARKLLIAGFRMILFKLPIVVPTRILWLVMLVLVGIFGFFAQVCHPVSVRSFLRLANHFDLQRYF